ncbi:helix-turn-helix domain-containing protein [Lactococcus protaetiae]|uniref:Helix-turn-helix transcriptional regulator n=1 Tax=Lactococcus protaetiae TaxID=2592653 RepID=A0A514Z5K6_9LACT|nr:helix-turn-helix transcriptional regulator [Lactococcus protaetiae]QDK69881.1 helix-turn-helix transcriptional regulator [Lactococcus protaetiae]
MKVFNELTNDYCDCLEKVRKWRGLTYKEIAEEIPMDEKSIRRIFHGETTAKIENLVCICLVLHLPYENIITSKSNHQRYHFALMYYHGNTLDETRRLLKLQGVTI